MADNTNKKRDPYAPFIIDADKRKEIGEKYKAAQKKDFYTGYMPTESGELQYTGQAGQLQKDLEYKYGTGTSGILALQDRERINRENAQKGFGVTPGEMVNSSALSTKQMYDLYYPKSVSNTSNTQVQKTQINTNQGQPSVNIGKSQTQYNQEKAKLEELKKKLSEIPAFRKDDPATRSLIRQIKKQEEEVQRSKSIMDNDILSNQNTMQNEPDKNMSPSLGPNEQLVGAPDISGAEMSGNLQFGQQFEQSQAGASPSGFQTGEYTGQKTTNTPQQPVGQYGQVGFDGMQMPGGGMTAGTQMMLGQVGTLQQQAQMGQTLAQDSYMIQEQGRQRQLMRTLGGTDLVQQALKAGYDPYTMTASELESLVSANGLRLSEDEKNRLTAGGLAQIENLKYEKNDRMAEVEMTRNRLSREYERALDEREDFNAQQDNSLKKALAAFGGGSVQSLAGNMEVMRAREKGQRAKENLLSDFGDKQTMLSIEANRTLRTYTSNVNSIEREMASVLDARYAEISEQVDNLIAQGITNKTDLNKAMYDIMKEYTTQYNNVTTEAAKMMDEQNRFMLNYDVTLREQQRKDDAMMSEAYGVVFQNGAPLMDSNGQPIPTYENMKFAMEQDKFMTEQTGYVYQNGQLMLDQNGQPVPSMSTSKFAFEQEKFYTQEDRLRQQQSFSQQMQQLGYNLDVNQYNLAVDKFNADNAQSAFANQLALQEAGFSMGRIDPQTGMINTDQGIFNTSGSKYTPFFNGDSVRFQVPEENGVLKTIDNLRGQCGAFVNDIIGKRVFGDSITQKLTKVATAIPQMGAAFVQATQGPYGHVGMVEKVDYNESGVPIGMEILDSNYKGNEKPSRAYVNISYQNGEPVYTRDDGSKMLIKGYTDSMLGTVDEVKGAIDRTQQPQQFQMTPTGDLYYKSPEQQQTQSQSYMQIAQDIMSPYSNMSLGDVPIAERSKVGQELVRMKNDAMKSGDVQGMLRASAGGSQPNATQQQSLTQTENVLMQLNDLEASISQMNTDPIIGAVRSKNPYDVQAQTIQAQITRLVPGLARGVFGEVGVLTDSDIRRYQQTIPNIGTPEGARELMLQATRDMVKRSMETQLKTMARSGVDVSGFADYYTELEAKTSPQGEDLEIEQLLKLLD